MSPVDHEVVRRKLAVLQNALAALEQAGPIDLETYRRDFWRRKGTERVLQEMIEAGMDIAAHVLVETGRAAPAVGLRNRLVHEYEEIDDQLVLGAVAQAQSLFPRFIVEIEGFLARTA